MTDIKSSVIKYVQTNKNTVIYASMLLVLLIVGAIIFSPYVLLLALVAFLVALPLDLAFSKWRKKPFDPGFMVTPLLLTLLMPPAIPLWVVGIGAFFAVLFGKNIFGGSGKYVFTPALVGAVFVLISFPSQMATHWVNPVTDIIGGATPLINLNNNLNPYPYTITQLLLGNVPGSLGETFRLGIIVLGLLLIALKIADWRIPLAYLGFFFIITAIFYYAFPDYLNARNIPYGKDPFTSLFVGGLLFGAFFIAVDPVIAPLTSKGKIIYGFGLALITFIIRNYGTFHEGVTFSLLIMAAVSPLIDNATQKKVEEVK
jgi:Na+-translocating ferredoxin:NAD+ oxidoreductase RnfD subunit